MYAVSNALEINNGTKPLSRTSLIYAMFTAVANGCAVCSISIKSVSSSLIKVKKLHLKQALYPVALIIILHMEISPVIVTSGLSTAEPEFTSNAIEMMDMNLTSISTSGFSQSTI